MNKIVKSRIQQSKNQQLLNRGLAEMFKGGVIMDVTTPQQAKIAENAGAVAVMALERVPSDIRKEGGVARMADPELVKKIKDAVTIPVMAKCRIGHTTEARILEAVKSDFIDESEVLTPADMKYHINKKQFRIPFVCGAVDLGQALRRINEGASMIRTKGEAGTGNIVEAVKHIRTINDQIAQLRRSDSETRKHAAKQMKVPYQLVKQTVKLGRLPVVNFAAGGIATPADAALCMELGMDGVFVGSGIFKSQNPAKMAKAIVEAVTHYKDYHKLAEISSGLGKSMPGKEIEQLEVRFSQRR